MHHLKPTSFGHCIFCPSINGFWLSLFGIFKLFSHSTDFPKKPASSDVDQLSSKLYDKRDDYKFPIVNFPFICNKIQATTAYEVYISQCMRYVSACAAYLHFLEIALLLTIKLLTRRIVKFRSKSSLRKPYGCYHELVDRNEVYGSNDSNGVRS